MKTKNKRDLEKHWAEQAKKAAKKTAAKPAENKSEAPAQPASKS
jgi:hypothetical protein